MSKSILSKNEYENFILDYINFRNQAGSYFLKMAEVIAQAKNKLKAKTFKKFLKDPRINLKRLQANKLITIYEVVKSDSRLTHIFNKEGVEKSYLITTIKDDEARNQFIEIIKNDDLTVKQTKQAISFIQNDSKTPIEAIEIVKELKTLPKASSVDAKQKVIPYDKYNNLKLEYDKVLAEKQALEKKLLELSKDNHKPDNSKQVVQQLHCEILLKPVKSELQELTLNKPSRSIVVKGYELPIPSGVNLDKLDIDFIKMSALNNAKNNHNLDLS